MGFAIDTGQEHLQQIEGIVEQSIVACDISFLVLENAPDSLYRIGLGIPVDNSPGMIRVDKGERVRLHAQQRTHLHEYRQIAEKEFLVAILEVLDDNGKPKMTYVSSPSLLNWEKPRKD